MSSIARRLLTGSGIYGLGSVITKISSLLLTPLYTHYLTPVPYGILATAIVLTSSLEMLLALHLEAAFSRFYFDTRDERRVILSFHSRTHRQNEITHLRK
jgi:O-antigen/teichoic acid export membrane protein